MLFFFVFLLEPLPPPTWNISRPRLCGSGDEHRELAASEAEDSSSEPIESELFTEDRELKRLFLRVVEVVEEEDCEDVQAERLRRREEDEEAAEAEDVDVGGDADELLEHLDLELNIDEDRLSCVLLFLLLLLLLLAKLSSELMTLAEEVEKASVSVPSPDSVKGDSIN